MVADWRRFRLQHDGTIGLLHSGAKMNSTFLIGLLAPRERSLYKAAKNTNVVSPPV